MQGLGDRYETTSSTSLSISISSKSLTVGTGLNYSPGQETIIAYDGSNFMTGTVTSYNSGSGALVANVSTIVGGPGPYSSWTVNLGGAAGPTGSQGTTGTQGVQGVQGVQGITGAQGIQGVQGATGTQGTQGVQGIQGTQGITGAQGTQGITGTQGAQGTTGTQGTTGSQGAQGNTGSQGTTGAQGTTGTQGIQGIVGTQGTQGVQGTTGTQGTQGIQGVQGIQGITGPSTTINATNNTTTTALYPVMVGAAGSNQTANVTTSGFLFNAAANVLTLGGTAAAGSAVLIVAGNIQTSTANATANIGNASNYFNRLFAQATTALYADLAEMYVSDADYSPGTVVSFGGNQEVTLTQVSSDPRVAGVISTHPAHTMNSGLQGEFTVAVALTGRVPTSVTGSVSKGDMMISAGNGFAQSCATPIIGTVIGKALQDFDGISGVIEIVVGRM